MLCTACTAEVPDEDVFCEMCGAQLPVSTATADGGGALAPQCLCGAAQGEVDEDGYCMQCGKRLLRPPSDHIEQEISPDFAGVSDRGLRHDKNEDRFALVELRRGFGVIVCDGVSTTDNPEATSALVAKVMAGALSDELNDDDKPCNAEQTLRRGFARAREQLCSALPGQGSGAPATTLVAALVMQEKITIAWAGDSRAYWLDSEGVTLLTRDHSWWRVMVESGELSEAEASASPQAHAITRWIGADESEAEEVVTHTVCSSGMLMLCTDGLWNYVLDPATLASLVSDSTVSCGDALGIARGLVDYANMRGGQDNVTVAVLRCGPPETDSNATKRL